MLPILDVPILAPYCPIFCPENGLESRGRRQILDYESSIHFIRGLFPNSFRNILKLDSRVSIWYETSSLCWELKAMIPVLLTIWIRVIGVCGRSARQATAWGRLLTLAGPMADAKRRKNFESRVIQDPQLHRACLSRSFPVIWTYWSITAST